MEKAIGCFEVQGYSVILASMDKACKAANVTILGIDLYAPKDESKALVPISAQAKFWGRVSDVEAAILAATEEARKYINEEDIITSVIPSTPEDMMRILKVERVKPKS